MKMLIKVTEEERDGEMWAIMTELFCGSQAECDAFIKRGGAGDTKAIVVAEVNSEEERANILKPMKVSEMKSPNKVDTSNVSWTLRLGQMREYISSTSNVRLAWFLPANPRPMLKIPMSLLV